MAELVFATAIDGIVTFVLFLIWQNEREIRGRLDKQTVVDDTLENKEENNEETKDNETNGEETGKLVNEDIEVVD